MSCKKVGLFSGRTSIFRERNNAFHRKIHRDRKNETFYVAPEGNPLVEVLVSIGRSSDSRECFIRGLGDRRTDPQVRGVFKQS